MDSKYYLPSSFFLFPPRELIVRKKNILNDAARWKQVFPGNLRVIRTVIEWDWDSIRESDYFSIHLHWTTTLGGTWSRKKEKKRKNYITRGIDSIGKSGINFAHPMINYREKFFSFILFPCFCIFLHQRGIRIGHDFSLQTIRQQFLQWNRQHAGHTTSTKIYTIGFRAGTYQNSWFSSYVWSRSRMCISFYKRIADDL